MPELEVATVEVGPDTDRLVHERVFKRSDDPPPYSSLRSVADWLAGEFELHVIPVRNLSDARPGDDLRSEEGAVGFMAMRQVPPTGDGSRSDGLQFFSGADTFELAVVRAVLVIAGVASDPTRVVKY